MHIGLAPQAAGFDIFENNFGNVLVDAGDQGRAHPHRRPRARRLGTPVRDVLLEIWQANAEGTYAHPADRQAGKALDPAFRGWGRACSDFETGVYTLRDDQAGPGASGRNGRPMAPHINFWIVARGINIGLNTRMYFSDEAEANAKDPVLNLIEWEGRRQTLIAQREEREAARASVYRFDIRLQGDGETVFFDI